MLYFRICKLIRYAKIDFSFLSRKMTIDWLTDWHIATKVLFVIFRYHYGHPREAIFIENDDCGCTYCWHMLIRSLSVVHCWRPLMYKFVFDKVSWTCGVPFGPMVVFVLLRLVLKVPLCEPVFDELLEFVLLGDAAVGTRVIYYTKWMRKKSMDNEKKKRNRMSTYCISIPRHCNESMFVPNSMRPTHDTPTIVKCKRLSTSNRTYRNQSGIHFLVARVVFHMEKWKSTIAPQKFSRSHEPRLAKLLRPPVTYSLCANIHRDENKKHLAADWRGPWWCWCVWWRFWERN